MDEKQLKENKLKRAISDEELDQVNGGMDIIMQDKYKKTLENMRKKYKKMR